MDSTRLIVEKIDEVWMRIGGEDYVLMELFEHFTFTVPNYKFMKSYKEGRFDGKIRLFNLYTKKTYIGLLDEVIDFASNRGYPIILNDMGKIGNKEIGAAKILEFIKGLKPTTKGNPLDIRDYQLDAVHHCINNNRSLILSPTSSGKSFIIYCIVMWNLFLLQEFERILLVVPNLGLIQQMCSDFEDYATDLFNIRSIIYPIFGGQSKYDIPERKKIIISTWQSIFTENADWFRQFNTIIFDEAHSCKADCLKGILETANKTPNRFGFTGTIDDAKVSGLVLQGLFGGIKKVISTSELMERNQIAQLKIKCLILSYPKEIRKDYHKIPYQDEISLIESYQKRNQVVLSLLASLGSNNTLVLFQKVEAHGKPFFELCKKEFPNKRIVYISGEVKGDERERLRKETETHNDSIIVASYGTMSTGISITNLHNVIFLSPYKSRIKVLQSIGRTLRLNSKKTTAVLYDIVDDISWKKHKNHTLNHFLLRTKIYDSENFDYKVYNIKL